MNYECCLLRREFPHDFISSWYRAIFRRLSGKCKMFVFASTKSAKPHARFAGILERNREKVQTTKISSFEGLCTHFTLTRGIFRFRLSPFRMLFRLLLVHLRMTYGLVWSLSLTPRSPHFTRYLASSDCLEIVWKKECSIGWRWAQNEGAKASSERNTCSLLWILIFQSLWGL